VKRAELPAHEAAILARLVGPDEVVLSPAAAKSILGLGFNPVDKDRMHALVVKARAGTLTADEQNEIQAYGRISSLRGILKSKARRALKRRDGNGKSKTG
jgi:hypothetical protein